MESQCWVPTRPPLPPRALGARALGFEGHTFQSLASGVSGLRLKLELLTSWTLLTDETMMRLQPTWQKELVVINTLHGLVNPNRGKTQDIIWELQRIGGRSRRNTI